MSIDFVMELLESSIYNTVMIVIDFVSKQAYFILTYTTITVEEVV